jgi:hypothetical protein
MRKVSEIEQIRILLLGLEEGAVKIAQTAVSLNGSVFFILSQHSINLVVDKVVLADTKHTLAVPSKGLANFIEVQTNLVGFVFEFKLRGFNPHFLGA